LDKRADEYGQALRDIFPAVDFISATSTQSCERELDTIDVLVCFGLSVSDDLLRAASRLKWIQALSSGVDYFRRSPELRREVILTSARGIHGPAMREHVIFLMQALSRNVSASVVRQHSGIWERKPWPLLHGKTAIILGTGISGTAIAEGLKALGMQVVGVSRTPRVSSSFDRLVDRNEFPIILPEADYLINVLPGGPENQHFIGGSVFQAMKRSAFFINVGRGDTVNEPALIEALRQNLIAGAALDVFETEPLPSDSPLWKMEKAFITPHVSGLFAEYPAHALPLIAENLNCFLRGDTAAMRNIV
jgi:D-2-hydroxyacid dehydrogenase (NADP+)